MSPGGSVDRLLGSGPAAAVASRLTSDRFRTLAFHDIGDAGGFADQVAYLAEAWHPVSGAEVAAAVDGGEPLPPRAVWITFDDGRPDVVEDGLPILAARDVPATIFVCPSVIDSGAPFWWQAIEARPEVTVEVDGRPLSGRPLVRALKRVSDVERRACMEEVLQAPESAPAPGQMDRALLERWVDSGREVGNHTWDHPILDRCTPQEQIGQVTRAHRWLTDFLGSPPDLFAYPNGDRTEVVASELFRLRYRTAPLFDHRLSRTDQPPFALSRVRIDAGAPMARTRAIVSGGHPVVFGWADRLPGRGAAA